MIKKNRNPLLIKQKVFSMFIDQVKTVGEFISKEGNSHKMQAPNTHNFVSGTTIPDTTISSADV